MPYELDIGSGKTPADLSVTRFTGKSHVLSEASPTALIGQFIFEQDAFNDGSLTVNGIPLVDISLGNITLTRNPVVTEHGVITATEALLNGKSLELTLSYEWTDIETVASGVFTGWSQLATQAAIDTKQDTLTFDAVPTTGSPHPVTSGGVKAAIESAISTVYKWKGSVDAVKDLPAQGNETGDVYNVRSSGANYGWTGAEWDNLGGIEAVDATPVKDSAFPVASGGVFDALATKQNNLVFDASPAADSANPVTSSGIRAAIDAIPEQVTADWQATEGKALVLNKPTTLAGFGITDAASKTELATGLANKQDTLVFDETPTAGSAHSVTSGAVRAAIDSAFGDLDTILEEILS